MVSGKKRESVVVWTSTEPWCVFWVHPVQSRRCIYPLGVHVGGCSWGWSCFGNHSHLCKRSLRQKRAAACVLSFGEGDQGCLVGGWPSSLAASGSGSCGAAMNGKRHTSLGENGETVSPVSVSHGAPEPFSSTWTEMVWQLLVWPVIFHLHWSVHNHTGRAFLLPPSLHFKCNSLL